MPVRIAHISDTHLGTRFREGIKQNMWAEEMRSRLLENDFYERFREMFEIIATMDPPVDLVVHSGDLYDTPTANNSRPPPEMARIVTQTALKGFIENTGIPILIIEGNHGLFRSYELSLLETLKIAIPGLEVFTQVDLKRALQEGTPLKKEYDNFEVFCFPFIGYDILESSNHVTVYNDWVTNCQVPNSKLPSVAVAHGMGADKSLHPAIMSMGYEYVALGHDHRQVKHSSNAWFAGSPERWRFDEAGLKKGFLVVDVAASKKPKITQIELDYRRPVLNEKIRIESEDTVDSIIDKVESWLEKNGFLSEWDPATAARIRLTFVGESTRLSGLELNTSLEILRTKILSVDSGYNVAQFVWPPKRSIIDHDSSAYPEIVSEYLIEDPETDFKAYLESQKISDDYDKARLTLIAVKALKLAASDTGRKLTPEALEEESQ